MSPLQTFLQGKLLHRIPRSLCGSKRENLPADLRQWSTIVLICPNLNQTKSKQERHIADPRPLLPQCVSLLQRAPFCRSTRHPIPQNQDDKSLCGNGYRISLRGGHRSHVNPAQQPLCPHRNSVDTALAVKPPLHSLQPTLPPFLFLSQTNNYPTPWSRGVRNLFRNGRKKLQRSGVKRNSRGQIKIPLCSSLMAKMFDLDALTHCLFKKKAGSPETLCRIPFTTGSARSKRFTRVGKQWDGPPASL